MPTDTAPLPPAPRAVTLDEAVRLAFDRYQGGDFAGAAAIGTDILRARPAHAAILHLLGVITFHQGDKGQARSFLAQTIAAAPDWAEPWTNLGCVLQSQDRTQDAIAAFRHAAALHPGSPGPHEALGNALAAAGRLDEAVQAYHCALALAPASAKVLCAFGNVRLLQCWYGAAIDAYTQALAAAPDLPEIWSNLGHALKDVGRIGEATAAFQTAIALRPDHAQAWSNLGSALKDQARHAEAVQAFSRATTLDPGFATARSNLIFLLNYLPEASEAAIGAAHAAWGRRHAAAPSAPPVFANPRRPERRLKVGYVSPDFRTHSVAYFFEPLAIHHDRAAVEVYGYAEVATPSPTTLRLKERADHWRFTVGLSHAAMAELIRADGIDILVDLAGHTGGNRLGVFALKPAPVQVTWLGYPNTTGLAAMDWRITDSLADPDGAEAFHTERLARLPGGFLCYSPQPDAPEVAPAPCLTHGHVTFGSFNNLAKLTEPTVAAWAAILHRVPGARLLLKSKQLADPDTGRRFLARFARHAIPPERITLAVWTLQPAHHLMLYAGMDIALDTFPYNGTTTTCEALWMGVPVVSLRGDRHAARVGADLLTRVGLSELTASDVADYVARAAALAGDPERLAAARADLRERMRASPLCDGRRFAAEMEAAYRRMWREWCSAVDG
ncbi:tetratricopeptide repeat protein [Azospirillum sp.]|uniref:O-linked N-acetylglucosamine transferase, SPINDLY family protein n=1 Tax=Azospirillum sp. TaxID=34012 RepID=UPI002D25A847|nr:tetratricopeptide repeat protein [Azospirillum sp.]HYD70467.1 tetratricopeptide repeat protein [Azospirillum sp.]